MPDKKEEEIIITPRDMGIPMREPSAPRKKKDYCIYRKKNDSTIAKK